MEAEELTQDLSKQQILNKKLKKEKMEINEKLTNTESKISLLLTELDSTKVLLNNALQEKKKFETAVLEMKNANALVKKNAEKQQIAKVQSEDTVN